MRIQSAVLLLALALGLGGCGPRAKVSHTWGTVDSQCAPILSLKVETDAEVTPKAVRAGGETLKSNTSFQRIGNAWEGSFTWPRIGEKSASLEMDLERAGEVHRVTYEAPISPNVADLHLWRAESDGRAVLFYADVALQPSDSPELKKAAARLVAEEIEFTVPVCRIANAVAPEGRVELAADALIYRVPLVHVLRVQLRQGISDDLNFPLAVSSLGGRKGELNIRISSHPLVQSLFRDVESTPWKAAPAYRPGAPLLSRSETAPVNLLRPAETTVAEVAAVADLRAKSTTVDTCSYRRRGGERSEFPDGSITRIRRDVVVSVREARTGRVIVSKTFAGTAPPPCPREVRYQRIGPDRGGTFKELEGTVPAVEPIQSWLRSL